MIRVMIVEDEPPTLWRTVSMVEQLDPAFSVVATAMNGQAALEKLQETPCDVVMTDIRMPVMDGLELMTRLHAEHPEIMLVVLSGYQDFEYVSRAIRARSLDYLLKPVSSQDMRGLLGRIREQYMLRSREQLQRSFAMELNKSAAGLPSTVEEGDPMGLCLFCAGSFPAGEDTEMYPTADFWQTRSLETLTQEIAPGFTGFTWEFMGNTQVERILIFQTAQEQLTPWVECLHETLLSNSDIPVSCVYWRKRILLGDMSGAMKNLRKALRDRMQVGRSLFLDVGPEDAPIETPNDEDMARNIARLLSSGRMGTQEAEKREIFTRMEREQWTQWRILDTLGAAARLMEQSSREEIRELARQYQAAFPDTVCTALSLKELEENIASLAVPFQQEEGSGRHDAVVEAMERYLREHYSEHITNQTLGVVFGYVPSYISMMFRRKYRVSPSEYLTEIRLEHAKRLIQEHPEMLIREVAEQVGFKSQHHFSRIFKKAEGVWPTGYRA